MMNYLGVDFHKHYSVLHLIDQSGTLIKKRKVLNRAIDFENYFSDLQGRKISAVTEACRNWPLIVDLLSEYTEDIKLAHPLKVKAIASAKIKTDSIDAEILAHLLRADLIPEAYLRCKKNQNQQKILRSRSFYVKMRTQVKNRIHSLIDAQGEEIRDGSKNFSDLFGVKGKVWMKALRLKKPDNILLKSMLTAENTLSRLIKQSDGLVKEIVAREADCRLLKTIPGIGDFFSVVLKVEIGDISRFRNSSKLCSYAGLVPSSYGSGGKVYHGRITKNGNKWLRWSMVEAVRPAITNNAEIRNYYYGIKKRKGTNPARVATARRLLCIVYRVLNEQSPFIENKNNSGAAFIAA